MGTMTTYEGGSYYVFPGGESGLFLQSVYKHVGQLLAQISWNNVAVLIIPLGHPV